MANVFDLGGSVARGVQTGMGVMQARRQNALADLYKTQGEGILAGDPGALNALAAQDPVQALNIQNTLATNRRAEAQFGMDQERHGLTMELTREQIASVRRQAADAAKAEAARMDAAALEQERQQLAGVVSGARQAIIAGPEAWEAFKGRMPPDMWQQSGIDPSTLTYETAPAALAVIVGMLEGIEEARKFGEGMVPQQPEPGFRQATSQEAAQYGATGGQFGPDGRFYPINPPSGMSVEVGQDGTTRIVQGPGAASSSAEPQVGEVYNPAEVQGTLDIIDDLMKDPAVAKVVGPIIGGGGNDVDNLNMVQRGLYGGEGLAAIQKINQLQSRAWLAARDMLKGGGPITDYESRKAEASVARLSRAQSEKEFMTALKDLRDAITEGMAKLEAAKNPASAAAPTQSGNAGGQVTPETVRTMSESDLANYVSSVGLQNIPDEILDVIEQRGGR